MLSDSTRFFPSGSHPGGLYLPNTAGPAILEAREVLDAIVSAIPSRGMFAEIGTWCGATAAFLADARPDATILCCDTFADHAYGPAPWWINRRPNMRLYWGSSCELFALVRPGSLSGALLDGDHRQEGLAEDLAGAAIAVAAGGPILVHDYGDPNWPGVAAAVDRFCTAHGYLMAAKRRSLVMLRRAPRA